MFDQAQLSAPARTRTTHVLQDLVSGRPIEVPAVVITAHPDDETLAMGGRLGRFKQLTLLQLTDGAPFHEADAKRAGFSDRFGYAAEREKEAQQALAVLSLDCRRVRAGAPDQSSIFLAGELLHIVQHELEHAALAFTHPYEGGHPDHDAAALILQLTCDLIHARGETPPLRLEFASYHHRSGELRTGEFWPEPACPEAVVTLERASKDIKILALAEYRTQAQVIARFVPGEERYRLAPRYDFAKAPPPGTAQYDLFDWPMTSARWRRIASALIAETAA